jgi:hypothetical protein
MINRLLQTTCLRILYGLRNLLQKLNEALPGGILAQDVRPDQ